MFSLVLGLTGRISWTISLIILTSTRLKDLTRIIPVWSLTRSVRGATGRSEASSNKETTENKHRNSEQNEQNTEIVS